MDKLWMKKTNLNMEAWFLVFQEYIYICNFNTQEHNTTTVW